MAEKFKIAGLGEILWDIYDDGRFIGGAPANFAAHIAQSGQQAYLFSRVGDDEPGHHAIESLKALHVNTSGVQTDIFQSTGSVKISLDAQGNPHYSCSTNVAFDDMRMDSSWEELAPQMQAVFFGLLAQRSETSREAVRQFLSMASSALKIFDINIRKWDTATEQKVKDSLEVADVIKMNQVELSILKEGFQSDLDDVVFLQDMLERYHLKLAALTLGQHGCCLVTENETEFDPGYFITPVDTTGAGDAFAAAMVVKYLQGASLTEIADAANSLAAFVSLQKGAVPRWSWRQLQEIMVTNL